VQITREVAVFGLHAESDYADGKYTPTGKVSVHFSVEGEASPSGPGIGSPINVTVSLDHNEAAQWPVGKQATLTLTAK
jgi:hypothetical protein